MDDKLKTSYPAAANLSAAQYKFVTLDSSGNVNVTGDGLRADGVLQDKPAAAGRAGEIVIGGRTPVLCGGSFSAGDALASDANGKAVTATSGEVVNAIAEEDSGGDTEIHMVRLTGGVATA